MRYRRGELIVCEDGLELQHASPRFAKTVFEHHGWGKDGGKTLVITRKKVENLWMALEGNEVGEVRRVKDVDVKNLLELGRIVVEKRALDDMLRAHQSDLVSKVRARV